MTIEKLIDFFDTNSIYLSRLDTFEDNLENIEPYDINEIKLLTLTKPTDANPEISEIKWKEIIELEKKRLFEIQNNLIETQKKRFVSCWILSDVESFGMWDTYGKSGFVIRFDREYFEKIIKESIPLQIEPTSKIDLLVAGEVFYQDFEKCYRTKKNLYFNIQHLENIFLLNTNLNSELLGLQTILKMKLDLDLNYLKLKT